MYFLVADHREHHVIPFLKTDFHHMHQNPIQKNQALLEIKQLFTGDYLICKSPSTILACIERKTYKDFAASLKDGRYKNRQKMLSLREQTNCQLYFFVEGPAFPNPQKKINHVAYASIITAMTHLMVRDHMFVIQTKNEAHSSQKLVQLFYAFSKEMVCVVPTSLTPTDEELCIKLWSSLSGISGVIGKILANTCSVAHLVSGKLPSQNIDQLKTPSNRPFPKKVKRMLISISKGNKELEIKLLSGVPNIGKKLAAEILKDHALLFFLNQPVECLANIQIAQKTRTIKLGMKRAEAIHYFLNWCGSAHVTVDSQNITKASRPTMQVATQLIATQPAATQPLHDVSDDASSDASSPTGHQTLSKEMPLNTA
ncbi:pEP364R [African swine fever virus]|uniref:ERCC4 domain-containing protein EP364R n=1 Tax=African swine fever virus TaxID=10497 RepID=A0A6G7KT62_ASF|nr:pEP364R [African swine fever virus]